MSSCNCQAGPPIGPTLASVCGGGPFMLFMGLLEVFIRSQCDLDDPCRRPQVSCYYTPLMKEIIMKYTYNFSRALLRI